MACSMPQCPRAAFSDALGMVAKAMDIQTLELVGRHRLASELLQAGLEVAFPTRDRGVLD